MQFFCLVNSVQIMASHPVSYYLVRPRRQRSTRAIQNVGVGARYSTAMLNQTEPLITAQDSSSKAFDADDSNSTILLQ